ncbi:MAG: HutD family protein [Neisseriaceae bacterium]|nr:HutD family protein [Neisseriaceae bacterium]
MHKITFQDLAVTPWKNGAGTTRQILIHPADATLDNFAFRVSAADINALGPFSNYAGIHRSLAVLTGQGLTLAMADGERVTFTPKHTIVDFDGAAAPSTLAYAEPILDIGVMSRMGHYRHRFSQHHYACQQTHHLSARHGLLLSLHPQPVTFRSQGLTLVLAPFDAVAFQHDAHFQLACAQSKQAPLPFFVAQFEPFSDPAK